MQVHCVTYYRIHKAEALLCELIKQVNEGELLIFARKLACLVGQIISMQSAIGAQGRPKTRYIYNIYDCMLTKASSNAPVIIR